ncbi:MAG TPA: tetratricopeptide repeat protein [Candidatus Acidoferrum sp.]|nr:tetratricopeptide repeat protein [Candidatus Acidoferrum sp.]
MAALKPSRAVRGTLLFGSVLCIMARSSLAQTDVVFIDGGYPQMCSDAAKSIGAPDPNVTITGSRLEVTPVAVCNRAIDDRATSLLDLAASYNNRGVIEFHDKDYAAALRDFARATALQPELAAAWINQGYTLEVQQQWGPALIAFDKGIALGPPDPAKAYFNRGIVHEESGHVREAYYDYKQASALAPDWNEPKNELLRFRVKTGAK